MKPLILIMSLLGLLNPAFAAPITFSGADLLNLPGATFPFGGRVVSGNGLLINNDPDAIVIGETLAILPLTQFNVDVSDFTIQLDITRLPDGRGQNNQDLLVVLSDGLNLFGGIFFDNGIDQAVYRTGQPVFLSGTTIIGFDAAPGQSAGVPTAVGSRYLAGLNFQVTENSTQVIGDINNGTASAAFNSPISLDPANGGLALHLISFATDGNFQFNTLSFPRGVSLPTPAPEPGTLGGLALGLTSLSLGLYRRRRR